MSIITFIVISCCLFIICIVLAIALWISNGVITELEKRKVSASQDLIDTVEKEMIKALKCHNLTKYYHYRKIFNDLEPVEKHNIMY